MPEDRRAATDQRPAVEGGDGRSLAALRRGHLQRGFGQAEARTTYGTIGIKVWIFKGEVLQRKARRIPE